LYVCVCFVLALTPSSLPSVLRRRCPHGARCGARWHRRSKTRERGLVRTPCAAIFPAGPVCPPNVHGGAGMRVAQVMQVTETVNIIPGFSQTGRSVVPEAVPCARVCARTHARPHPARLLPPRAGHAAADGRGLVHGQARTRCVLAWIQTCRVLIWRGQECCGVRDELLGSW